MRLELGRFHVQHVILAPAGVTQFSGNTLTIGLDDAVPVAASVAGLQNVRLSVVAPGESARIVHVLDAIEPRVKVAGPGVVFPGFLGTTEAVGRGRTHALAGVAVVTTGLLPGTQEGIIDMSGPGAELSPLARTWNLVLQASRSPGTSDREYDGALRRAGLKLATYLAEATRSLDPDEVDLCELPPVDPALPRIGYVYLLQSQGDFRDTFLYGSDVRRLVPTLLHPAELWDGAVVSGNYIIACQKNPTYLHQQNPVVAELLRRHGRDLCFTGVILANEHNTLVDKVTSSGFAAKLAQMLGLAAVIVSQEGGGHADSDLMLACRACEQVGVRTVLLANEIAGPGGDLPSLVDITPEADAIVSTGNNDEFVELPSVEKVIGGDTISGVAGPAGGALRIQLGLIYCATNQFGANRLTAALY